MEILALQQAISFHKFIGLFLILTIIVNLAGLFFIKNFLKLHKLMWILTPLFMGILGISVLSGISILAMLKFSTKGAVYFMIFVNILIVALELYRIKKLRATRKNPNLRNKYLQISKIFYILYFALILCLYKI